MFAVDRKIRNGTQSSQVPKTTSVRLRTKADVIAAMTWSLAHADSIRRGGGTSGAQRGSLRDETGSRSPWSGTETLDEFLRMTRDGWPEGLDGTTEFEGLSTDDGRKVMLHRDVAGAFPIVPAHIAGVPDAMLCPRADTAESVRSCTLAVDLSFNVSTDCETVLEYAKQIMRVVSWLQAEGIDCAVVGVLCLHQLRGRYVYLIPIREHGEALDASAIAAWIHPATLRRGYFAVVEYEHHVLNLPNTCVCTSGFGSARSATAEELRASLPEAQSVIILPKPGRGDPQKTIAEALSLKIRH